MIAADRGATAVLTAAAMVLLLGAAALAVDASGFFQDARSQQRAADLACLAGVVEAPLDSAAAVTKAAEYLRPNHPLLAAMSTTPDSGAASAGINTFTLDEFAVEIETPWDDEKPWTRNDALMRVSIVRASPTYFARIFGRSSVDVAQESYCQVGSPLGLGNMPLALDADAAEQCEEDGTGCTVKYTASDCTVENSPGNCGSVDIPRYSDPPGTASSSASDEYQYNLALGSNWRLVAGDPNTCRTGANKVEDCGWLRGVPGNKLDQITNGLLTGFGGFPGRLDGGIPHDENFSAGVNWDNHQLGYAANCDASGPGDEDDPDCLDPVTGLPDTTGPASVTRVVDCTDPRWSAIPIVEEFDNGANPSAYKETKFVWLQEPDGIDPPTDPNHIDDELTPGDKLQIVSIRMVSFPLAENTPVEDLDRCSFYEFVEGAPASVRLVKP